jgi:hypothetical protein
MFPARNGDVMAKQSEKEGSIAGKIRYRSYLPPVT